MKRVLQIQVLAGLLICNIASAAVHVVEQVGISFIPAEITVAPGDTVQWVRSSLSHTVTSGTNCTFDGLWFNEPLNAFNPVVNWVVPGTAVGDVPYYCIPHCAFGMTGIIHVVDACPEDIDGSGAVDVGDILAVIAFWGQSGVPEDLNGSGVVDVSDLLILIGAWGPC